MNLTINHDKDSQRFLAAKDGKESVLKYKIIDDQTLDYFSTFVPEELRNQGIAAKITDYALNYAKENHYQIVASCPYVKNYITNHPEYQSLLKK